MSSSWEHERLIDELLKHKFVRALDLQRVVPKIILSSVGKLKHLRYLDLSCNKTIEVFPDSITKLVNL